MAKKQSGSELQARISAAFDHWAISDEAKKRLAEQFETEAEAPPPQNDAPAEEAPRVSKTETPKRRLQNRVSKTETQKRRLKNGDSGRKNPRVQKRTFQNKLYTAPSSTAIELQSNIPKRRFFRYYNALHDTVLPQIPRGSRLVLCVMFRRSHGFNRNWCSMSLRDLVYATGMGENTVRRSLAPLINDSWVAIASDGYREATTYVLQIPVDDAEDEEETEEEDGEAESPKRSLQIGDSKMEGRVAKMESPEWQPCTGSTSTGQSTGQQPDSNPEVHPYSVQPEAIQETGENQVEGNLALKHPASLDPQHRNQVPSGSYLSDTEAAYIDSRASPEQNEIFDAQDAWDEVIGDGSRPPASKLNEMLGHLRELGYRGEGLDERFRQCLEQTRGRARDPVAWMISALKSGRYP